MLRIEPPLALARAANVVFFLGSSVEEMAPSLMTSLAASTFRSAAARRRRSLRSLSAALKTAAPCNVMVLPPYQVLLEGARSESPQTTRMRSRVVNPRISATT